MEWLLAHEGEAIPATATEPIQATDTAVPITEAAGSSTEDANAADAKSLKCDECNRLFKTQLEVEFHAAKSGHSSFSESTEEKKPLTEDEKQAQLLLLEEKLKQKRQAREEEEKRDALDREKVRIKMGKEMAEAKRKMEEQEMAKILDQRRREKEEEKVARDRVRAQIEADKAARRAKLSGEPTSPTGPGIATAPMVSPVAAPSLSAALKKDYATTKIQIRLPDGKAVTEEFNVLENLAAVKVFIEVNHYDLPFRLMTAYPRKVFDETDLEKPLSVLGKNLILVVLFIISPSVGHV